MNLGGGVMRIRELETIEYNYWINESVVQQAKDRTSINGLNWTDELEGLFETISKLLPNGKDSEGHLMRVLDIDDASNIGFIWFGILPRMEKGSIFLMDIMLDKRFRSKGYGKKLLTSMHSNLLEMGYTSIYLNVLRKNYAMKLYEALGYKEIGGDKFHSEMKLDLK